MCPYFRSDIFPLSFLLDLLFPCVHFYGSSPLSCPFLWVQFILLIFDAFCGFCASKGDILKILSHFYDTCNPELFPGTTIFPLRGTPFFPLGSLGFPTLSFVHRWGPGCRIHSRLLSLPTAPLAKSRGPVAVMTVRAWIHSDRRADEASCGPM